MHGNISEVCADKYQNKLTGGKDPFFTQTKDDCFVFRGGSWSSKASYCMTGFRQRGEVKQENFLGVRIVLAKKIKGYKVK